MTKFTSKRALILDVIFGRYNPDKTTYSLKCYKVDDLYLTTIAFKHHRNLLAVSFFIFIICFGPFTEFDSILGFKPVGNVKSYYLLVILLPILIYELVMFWFSSNESRKRFAQPGEHEAKLDKPIDIVLFSTGDLNSALKESGILLEKLLTEWQSKHDQIVKRKDTSEFLSTVYTRLSDQFENQWLSINASLSNYRPDEHESTIGNLTNSVNEQVQLIHDNTRRTIHFIKTNTDDFIQSISQVTYDAITAELKLKLENIEKLQEEQLKSIGNLIGRLDGVSPSVKSSTILYIYAPRLIGLCALLSILLNPNIKLEIIGFTQSVMFFMQEKLMIFAS